jgi:hypothetical protein
MLGFAKRMVPAMLAGVGLSLAAGPAAAEPTPVTVHVISKGAKFIGSSMGGAHVTITNVRTGEVMASGVTSGSTGSTSHIMQTAHPRGTPLSKGGAAKFAATLDIDRPQKIKVTAHGPTAQAQAANTVSATQWILPGKGMTAGDGFLLEMPGFVVDVQEPPAHLKLAGTPQTVALEANVTMMCGCPIRPDGLWDANAYDVTAMIYRNGEMMREASLSYAGATSQFATELTFEQPGSYQAIVYAYDPKTGNTGLDKVTFGID